MKLSSFIISMFFFISLTAQQQIKDTFDFSYDTIFNKKGLPSVLLVKS